MKSIIALVTTLTLFAATNALAATEITGRQANNLIANEYAVISVNHDVQNVQEVLPQLQQEATAQGAKYYQVIVMHEPESNGQMHVSAALFR